MSRHTLFYSPQCPNCVRFVGALNRTPVRAPVTLVDVATLSPDRRRHVPAVPMLVTAQGTVHVGTQAFAWLKQFEGEAELETFCPMGRGLPFSDVTDAQCTLTLSTPYGAFQQVP